MPADDRPWQRGGYALPYYTRDDGDTEYLIANPGPSPVHGNAYIFGPDCSLVGDPIRLDIAPHCARSIRFKTIVPNVAGHAILAVDGRLSIGLFFERQRDSAVVANSLGGHDQLVEWVSPPIRKTYGFVYRARPFGSDSLEASIFVSNPNATRIGGLLTLYDWRCESFGSLKFSIAPDCTREFKLPAGQFGCGEIRVLTPAILHLVHYAASASYTANATGLTSSELLGIADEVG